MYYKALDYLTPMEYITNYNGNLKQKVLPMYSANTIWYNADGKSVE